LQNKKIKMASKCKFCNKVGTFQLSNHLSNAKYPSVRETKKKKFLKNSKSLKCEDLTLQRLEHFVSTISFKK
jgi:hypothetical protein